VNTSRRVPLRSEITGLILAGGRASRMGGLDKGLQLLGGQPLVRHALERLEPQVASVMISANRNLEAYAELGVPVWPDTSSELRGALAGVEAGLRHCPTDWLACVPCDSPYFPLDLVTRLAGALGEREVAVATTQEAGRSRREPVFCLVRCSLRADLSSFLDQGGRKFETWLQGHSPMDVPFGSAEAFANINTLDELRAASRAAPR
jgi:molybdopterin-guanine dinucleotide biosynthesis protein A